VGGIVLASLMNEQPGVCEIMEEIKRGLEDTSLSEATRALAEEVVLKKAALRQAHAYAPVLGRCGGSLSGRLCTWLKPLAKPVLEQIDLFHGAVLGLLEKLVTDNADAAELKLKVQELEKRLRQLEGQPQRDA
jgi:hypothetical protein